MIKALAYFLEIIRGALVTTRHFIVNMWFHILNLFGIKTKRKGAVTIQYPEEKKEIAYRHRSLHRLLKRDNGRPRCVVCMLCATTCPSECIYIEAAEDPADDEFQKYPATFIIDLSRCCFCGFCVEACPEDALRMDTQKIELAEYSRLDLIYDLEKLVQ
ncbi:NADH-quinone oxidoreductase subunit I [Candidatus Aminicenantes bacterium AC-334-K16]|jgi:NADH-quinone oxidoreductase subunit I|nr:NADH-quinone oxidoreductase subunit I [Candidatus Aminicenantes bacterium AC-334-K16]